MKSLHLLIALFFPFCSVFSHEPQLEITELSEKQYQLDLHIPVPKGDALYADYMSFSVDHPHIQLSDWHASNQPTLKYDTHFKQTKRIYEKPLHIAMSADLSSRDISDAKLHVAMFSRSTQKHSNYLMPLLFSAKAKSDSISFENNQPRTATEPITHNSSKKEPLSFQQKLSALFAETDSWTMRLLLALLLGLLLSLTPCIYPMIPITVGILQSQGSKSIGRNFIRAFTYILGIATMFALLGTVAAFSGKMFGTFMKNPLVILTVVALLAYLAGSMIGLYEMYIPRFLQSNNQKVNGGSLASIFLFGIASGSIASPCLSPGLVLLLTWVTALGSIPLGFVLLFFFGLGLGIPLLIIGTFSGSLNMMPRAGTWMVDIKQIFGFIMLATCFYFLGIIFPAYIVMAGATLFSIAVAFFYFRAAGKAHSFANRVIKNLIGIGCIAGAVYLGYEAYKQFDLYFQESKQENFWLHDYAMAVAQAEQQHKKLLIDVSAPYCSICKAIDKKMFARMDVQEKMKQFVTVKIDDIEENDETLKLQKRFNIMGAPTILVYDPQDNKELKRWGSELYDESPEQFIEELG